MKTDDLIQAIARDPALKSPPPGRSVWVALAVSVPLALLLFLAMLGPRPDIGTAVETLRFPLKFVLTLTLAVAALALTLLLAIPGADWHGRARWLWLAPALLVAAVIIELFVTPMGDWPARWHGQNWLICLGSIPLLSAAPLAGLLLALRNGAPDRPRLAGAIAGLAAGGIGATLYAAHCPDDSPLFVATWYVIAIAAIALIGAWLGARLLRW